MNKDLIEETVDSLRGSLENKQALRRLLNGLASKAVRGNWAWNRLEQYFGFDGDNMQGDDGGERINNF